MHDVGCASGRLREGDCFLSGGDDPGDLDDQAWIDSVGREQAVDVDERLPRDSVTPGDGGNCVACLDYVGHQLHGIGALSPLGNDEALPDVDAARVRDAVGVGNGVHRCAVLLGNGEQCLSPLHVVYGCFRGLARLCLHQRCRRHKQQRDYKQGGSPLAH